MREIYLLMETIGSYSDYHNEPILSVSDKELADKIVDGLNDTSDYLQGIEWSSWLDNAKRYLCDLYYADDEANYAAYSNIVEEIDGIAGMSVEYDYPTYSVSKLEHYDTM